MMALRRKLAAALDRMGVPRAVLALRARSLYPWSALTALTYHRVGSTLAPGFDPDVLDATPAVFERQVQFLQQHFTLIDTRDLDAWRQGGTLPRNCAMITFDDGYRDGHDVVLPILQRLQAKAVFFVSTSYIEERRVFWWELVNHALSAATRTRVLLRYPQPLDLSLADRSQRKEAVATVLRLLKAEDGVDMDRFIADLYAAAGVPFGRERERQMADDMLMTWDHVRALAAAGLDVQSHSYAHRVLHTLTTSQARQDLLRARQDLEGALDRPVHAVAYPTGRPLGDAAELRQAVLDAGYRYGFTVQRLVPMRRLSDDWLGIPRMMMDQAVTDSFFRAIVAMPTLSY
jgi:peptidoglycan/xylan/chitin deacetylase (PgdA/CDA1 family)